MGRREWRVPHLYMTSSISSTRRGRRGSAKFVTSLLGARSRGSGYSTTSSGLSKSSAEPESGARETRRQRTSKLRSRAGVSDLSTGHQREPQQTRRLHTNTDESRAGVSKPKGLRMGPGERGDKHIGRLRRRASHFPGVTGYPKNLTRPPPPAPRTNCKQLNLSWIGDISRASLSSLSSPREVSAEVGKRERTWDSVSKGAKHESESESRRAGVGGLPASPVPCSLRASISARNPIPRRAATATGDCPEGEAPLPVLGQNLALSLSASGAPGVLPQKPLLWDSDVGGLCGRLLSIELSLRGHREGTDKT